jgi:hypothetical protein
MLGTLWEKSMKTTTKVLLTAAQVRQRYGGLSEMGLWRWIRDERLGFPQPLTVNNRRYWWKHELEEWERTRAARQEVA